MKNGMIFVRFLALAHTAVRFSIDGTARSSFFNRFIKSYYFRPVFAAMSIFLCDSFLIVSLMIIHLKFFMLNKSSSYHNLIGPPRHTTLNNLIVCHSLNQEVITFHSLNTAMLHLLLNQFSEILFYRHYCNVLVVWVIFEQVDLLMEKILQNDNLRFF
jgi:hypothetical protein